MLVSHWAVYSVATAKLVGDAIGIGGRSPDVGYAEVLHRAMLAMIKQGGRDAHPTFGAPFIVVGEGAIRTSAWVKRAGKLKQLQ
jgi:CHAT domain-containing protein